MKRVGSLFVKIVEPENIYLAAFKALSGKKGRASVAHFYFHLETELLALHNELSSESYNPRPYRRFEIREPKIRKICSSDIRDRVVHHAICNHLEPLFERRLIYDSFACRVGKGSHVAIERCQDYARGHDYYLKCDIKKYFESIDHGVLKRLLRRIIKDGALLRLLDKIIDHQVPGSTPGRGLPIGNLTSQHFANLFLGELDHFLKEEKGVRGYVRYMDDFILFDDSKERLHILLYEIREYVGHQLGLELKEKVVRIAPVAEGVPFLGFGLFRNLIRIQRPNLVRWRRIATTTMRPTGTTIWGSAWRVQRFRVMAAVQGLRSRATQALSRSLLPGLAKARRIMQ
jgi:RNA-directed DNA polymerase